MDIEQLEALALSDDRGAALAALVPGTEDHDYWRAIHLQHAGQLDQVDKLLDAWRNRHGDSERRQRIERRQLVLRAGLDLAGHADQLADEVGVSFDHEPAIETETARYPSKLGAALIDAEQLFEVALAGRRGLSDLTSAAYPSLVGRPLDANRRRTVLQGLERTGLPGLIDMIVADLGESSSRGFGSLPIHNLLTLAELEQLATRLPELRKHDAWVEAVLLRLRPPGHVDWVLDPVERLAYLDLLWRHVESLPASFNSLKVHVLYHRLDHDLHAETFDRGRLLTYLALPRRSSYARVSWLKGLESAIIAVLHQDYARITGLPPVGDDERLVRTYLARFLAGEDSRGFADHVEPWWLDALLAETRLLAGDDDQRWTTILGSAAVTSLRDRVDLELLPSNPPVVGRDQPVELHVAIKNTGPIRQRVFRINTVAHFLTRGRDVDTSLDLDGLAAGWEETRPWSAPALRRVEERLGFDACDRPGTYIIELIGNGKASRALIRKGDLRYTTRPSPAGLALEILDETGARRPSASVWMGGREYQPRDDGSITLPFSTRSGPVPILLVDGDLAVASSVTLPAERYEFDATILLDRQSVRPGADAPCVIRASLTVGGVPTTLALVEDAYAEITVIDRAGVPARRRQPLTLADDGDVELTVTVPENLDRLEIAVGGRVRVVSEQRTLDVRAELDTRVGTQHAGACTETAYLIRSRTGYSLALLGKSGEARAGRAVALQLTHRFAARTIDVTLATDEHGRIELGPLPDIVRVTAALADDNRPSFELDPPAPHAAGLIHAREGDEVAIAIPVELDRPVPRASDWSVVELRGGVPAVDHAERVAVEPGVLRARGLPPGEHVVRVAGMAPVAVRVVPGAAPVSGAWASLARTLIELSRPSPIVTEAAAGPDGLTVTVAGAGPATRVHVIATALFPAPAWPEPLRAALPSVAARGHRPPESHYVSGRDIGDEYRYVLDRQHAPRRPGIMLDRPALLLNPWSLRTTSTSVQTAAASGAWAPQSARPAPAQRMAEMRRDAGPTADDPSFAIHDFLAAAPVVLANLRPDGDGRVHVAADQLAGAQVVRVLCADPGATSERTVAFDPTALAVRDLRLPRALPADQHLRENRRLGALPAGQTLTVADRATSRVELVDSVDKLYRALCALSGDDDLAAWDFLPRWSRLSRAERLTLYSKHACHELALFIHGKDRALFDEVVRPYLASKLHKTFIDHYLLEHDLTPYLVSWRLARLNAFERALLARRLPEARAALARTLADAVELIAPDPEGDDRLVDALLAGGALSGDSPDLGSAAAPAAEIDMLGDFDDEAPEKAAAEEEAPRAKRKRSAPRRAAAGPMAPPPAPMPGGGMAMSTLAGGYAADMDRLGADLKEREQAAPLYRGEDKTQEWAEHNWWHKRVAEQGAELIEPTRLWRDLAGHDDGPFLSPHVADAAAGFAASLCALAVIDLPFEAAAHTIVTDGAGGAGARITAGSHALAAVAELAAVDGPPSGQVLVGQSYFRMDDRWEWDGAEQREKYVTGELLIGTVYQGQVVITNPTSRVQRLAALIQIPAGAVAVSGGVATRTHRVELSPYATTALEYGFYFPSAGAFEHYGVQVVRGDELVAAEASRTLEVVRAPSQVDTGSWPHVSQRGSLDDVVAYLTTRNLGRIDLDAIAWRLRERDAFDRITAALAARHVHDDTVWSYAVHHRDPTRTAEWLAHQDDFLSEAGPVLDSPLAVIDPVERGTYQHLEYAPLVNARAHRLGQRRTVLNDGLAGQWREFLDVVATRPAPRAEDRLAAAHYFFTMDRPDDAATALAHTDGAAPVAPLQAAYLGAYAAAAAGDLAAARTLAAPHAAHPVDRWRSRFAGLVAMLDEVEGGGPAAASDADSRGQKMAELAARQPTLAVKVEDGHVVLDHTNLSGAAVRFYRMDVELLFSRQPFLGADSERFAFIEPGAARDVELDPSGRTRIALPDDLRQTNVVVEVVAGALRRSVTHFAHDLAVAVSGGYGQVQVRRASTGGFLPATYVKCYARMRGGAVQFFKDGYTDLRGRFDYATLSTDDLDRAERLALLVLHDQAGATVLETDPPVR